MQHVIETDQVEEIDFLTGNDAYKQDWMNERRQRLGMACALNQGRPDSIQNGLKSLKGLLKNWFGKV
jgi:CelD/BcsL family acetyltransferase involved in cellulose biosynthesis